MTASQVGPLGPELFPVEQFDVVTLIDVFEHVPGLGNGTLWVPTGEMLVLAERIG